MKDIRNFCIIAHVDHGKSTLADRLLENTGTVEKRRMKAQYLDQLELERERGITIKMAPVRMQYKLDDKEYTLNLIDTPGHSDFSYEVSRALEAVDGAILLVDSTQGIQAQTLATFYSAKAAGLKIIGAVNKIDLPSSMLEESIKSTAELIGVEEKDILKISGKTGQGVEDLLKEIIKQVPAPKEDGSPIFKALVFDSFYHEHKGIVANVRVFSGELTDTSSAHLVATNTNFKVKELGHFSPELKTDKKIENNQIGYIATGLKDPDSLKIGDTVISSPASHPISDYKQHALPGYKDPQPVVFVSFYPEDNDEYDDLKKAFSKLRLNDSAIKFEPDFNEFLGRGLKTGFLGRLHFEITAERLEREFNIKTVHSFPSVSYKIKLRDNDDWIEVTNPKDFPMDYLEAMEPTAKIKILSPAIYLGSVMGLQEVFRIKNMVTESIGNAVLITASIPLSELIRDFDDQLKSVSAGFASLSYEVADYEKAKVAKLGILVAGHDVSGLTRIVHKEDVEREGRKSVEKLKNLLPKQQFAQSLQATSNGKIIARENIPAMKKDVTGHLYGGDRTRKMKLWKKQKRGKEKLKGLASKSKINVPANVFRELLKK
ncbi:elongation factor 4 [Candidatus Nomurabacteria bacterium CG10_big_fil_rev_8_21_14_0_10_35_16]|uniref:Elongation factor 4 n=1 Tax=Candidatus Nomurabacteria bacterium CG10_big_fil_rev_8_21_14_0_10_35_16 TaxID=1974731 RepID=A0A2H0TBQ3_9BACT|nr:MAG: elongation factor 4 [Candidatus Nomurabacteria bacterium CG10_big_fil_rev_8_21_14_0_10_35_16]